MVVRDASYCNICNITERKTFCHRSFCTLLKKNTETNERINNEIVKTGLVIFWKNVTIKALLNLPQN